MRSIGACGQCTGVVVPLWKAFVNKNFVMITYLVILALLGVLEVCYFKVADRFNIIDKPNERSSHTRIVLRGGGIIFTIALWVWNIWAGFQYPWMLAGVTLAAGIWFPTLGYVVDYTNRIDCGSRGDEHLQLYGWYQWHYGGLCAGNADSALSEE